MIFYRFRVQPLRSLQAPNALNGDKRAEIFEVLVHWIVDNKQSLSVVESEAFIVFCRNSTERFRFLLVEVSQEEWKNVMNNRYKNSRQSWKTYQAVLL